MLITTNQYDILHQRSPWHSKFCSSEEAFVSTFDALLHSCYSALSSLCVHHELMVHIRMHQNASQTPKTANFFWMTILPTPPQ